jgi:hypothetical protein
MTKEIRFQTAVKLYLEAIKHNVLKIIILFIFWHDLVSIRDKSSQRKIIYNKIMRHGNKLKSNNKKMFENGLMSNNPGNRKRGDSGMFRI